MPAVGPELDLHSLSVEDALLQLDQYLDRAFRAGFHSVRIVHGKGTGTLRRVVRERLAGHPLIKSYRIAEPRQGGHGVTVVELAEW